MSTQASYQLLDPNFIGVIFSCFNDTDKVSRHLHQHGNVECDFNMACRKRVECSSSVSSQSPGETQGNEKTNVSKYKINEYLLLPTFVAVLFKTKTIHFANFGLVFAKLILPSN